MSRKTARTMRCTVDLLMGKKEQNSRLETSTAVRAGLKVTGAQELRMQKARLQSGCAATVFNKALFDLPCPVISFVPVAD
jgi:hypothetical protein